MFLFFPLNYDWFINRAISFVSSVPIRMNQPWDKVYMGKEKTIGHHTMGHKFLFLCGRAFFRRPLSPRNKMPYIYIYISGIETRNRTFAWDNIHNGWDIKASRRAIVLLGYWDWYKLFYGEIYSYHSVYWIINQFYW